MSDEERKATISASREALDAAGLKDTVIVAGTGGGSARHTIKLCKEAKEAGADYA
jgi:4-hydroxy-2-oxoglutarate aldolase